MKYKSSSAITANTWITVSDCYVNITPGIWFLQLYIGGWTNTSPYHLSATFHDESTNDTIVWAEIGHDINMPALTPIAYQNHTTQGLWTITVSKKLTAKIWSSITAPGQIDIEAVAYPLKLF